MRLLLRVSFRTHQNSSSNKYGISWIRAEPDKLLGFVLKLLELQGIGLVLFLSGGNSLVDEYSISVIARNRIKRVVLLSENLSSLNFCRRSLVVGELLVVKLSSPRSCRWQTLGRQTLVVALSLLANSCWRRRTRARALVVGKLLALANSRSRSRQNRALVEIAHSLLLR